jgi:hypothetical protein
MRAAQVPTSAKRVFISLVAIEVPFIVLLSLSEIYRRKMPSGD